VVSAAPPPIAEVRWRRAVRIIRSIHPPIDLFEDIADPADWPLIVNAEQKTNPRLMESIGNLDLVPPERRVSGPGASWLMAPFVHASPDRPSRFSEGRFGVLYIARAFETALFETIHHHARFMARTAERPGWTSQFREIVVDVEARLHDLRPSPPPGTLDPDDYGPAQRLAADLRIAGSDGVIYASVRHSGGECCGLFHPDGAKSPTQGRHLDYHWDGARVDLVRDSTAGRIWRVAENGAGA
jgi:hypothetical protein